MKSGLFALILALGAAAITPVANAAVPTTLSFSARLVDDATGDAVTGAHHLEFELFDVEAGGTALWNEGRDLEVEDGLVFADIGETKALDPAIFDGRKLFLQVKLDEAVMEPRIGLGSVPYAMRAEVATNAELVGGLAAEQLQQRVTGACGSGNFIIGVNPDGTVVCAPDLSGSGDITDVLAGSGLQGGGTGGGVTLSMLLTCAPTEVLKWNGTAWACAGDSNSGGDVTAVNTAAGSGLAGGGGAGDLSLSLIACANGQVLKFNSGAWGCAADIDTDTNSGGDITSVITGGNSGLVGGTAAGDASLSLLTSCAPGQLLKFNGTAWGCANDIDTDTDTNSGGDITDVIAGAGLTGGGGAGSVTLDIGAGAGITVGANTVSLDTVFTDSRYDARYVNITGDTMTGTLDMAQQRVTNRGCPAGYVRHGAGICLEDIDQGGLTFSGCANRCRAAGTHLCSSAEIRGVMQSGITINNGGVIGDWVDDQDAFNTALVINSNTDTNNFTAAPVTNTNFCRCCADIE